MSNETEEKPQTLQNGKAKNPYHGVKLTREELDTVDRFIKKNDSTEVGRARGNAEVLEELLKSGLLERPIGLCCFGRMRAGKAPYQKKSVVVSKDLAKAQIEIGKLTKNMSVETLLLLAQRGVGEKVRELMEKIKVPMAELAKITASSKTNDPLIMGVLSDYTDEFDNMNSFLAYWGSEA